jgi:hypothetical protein
VERFGNRAQANAAIAASSGWLIDGVEVRLNHVAGIHMGPGTVVRCDYIYHNGQIGTTGPSPRARGSYWSNPETRAFGELLIDCEEDRALRAVLVAMLRDARRDGAAS